MKDKESSKKVDDAELIRRQLASTYGGDPSKMLKPEKSEAVRKGLGSRAEVEELQKPKSSKRDELEIQKEFDLFLKGYQILISEIKEKAVNSEFRANFDLQPVQVKDCLISDSLMEQLKRDLLKLGMNKSCYLDKACGFTDNVLLNFYEIGSFHFRQANMQKAIPIFTFLVNLTPDVAPFWYSLAISLEKDQQYEKAIQACEFMIKLETGDFSPFVCLVRCCEQIKDFSRATELLQEYKDDPALKEDIVGALGYIEREEHKQHV